MIEKSSKISKVAAILIIFLYCMLFNINVFANEIEELEKAGIISRLEYSEDYKKWLSLSDEEKQEAMEPYPFDIEYKKDNELEVLEDELPEKFDLREVLAEKGMPMKVKTQDADNCWAYQIIAVAESNLALTKGIDVDLSERHMDYTLSNSFTEDNIYGFIRSAGTAMTTRKGLLYLINGIGAVAECNCEGECDHDLKTPEVSNFETKDLSYITEFDLAAYAEDYVAFPSIYPTTNAEKRQNVINDIKKHIMNYGAVTGSTTVYAFLDESDYMNPDTGAIYYNGNKPYSHGVAIVGWDDNYDVSNFNKNNQPSSNGAWIVKNSWGEGIGDNGYFYFSYEDYLILRDTFGIRNMNTVKEFDNIYQDDYGFNIEGSFANEGTIYEAEEFDTKYSNEQLYKLSLHTGDYAVCKIYIDPDSNGGEPKQSFNSLYTENKIYKLHPGYNTMYLDNPVKLGDKYTIYLVFNKNNGEKNNIYYSTSKTDTTSYMRI